MKSTTKPALSFDQGTLVLDGFSSKAVEKIFPDIPWQLDPRTNQYRTDACHYTQIEAQLSKVAGTIENDVHRWQKVAWSTNNLPQLRPEQLEAIECLSKKQFRGLVVMPTGTGKTVVAIEAARKLSVATLFVAPIRDLMYQWHRRIMELLGYDSGVIGDSTFDVRAISVTTYDSAAIHMRTLGNCFGMLVFDECHHLPGDFYRDAALMSAAPFRIGLTATPHRSDGKHERLRELIGDVAYELNLIQATGSLLADYRIVRIPVALSDSERTRYDQLSDQIRSYVYERRQNDSTFTWEKLCNESEPRSSRSRDHESLSKKIAIENRAEEKLRVLEDLFRLHAGEPTIVFVGSNAMAREVSLRFLIPSLLSHCGKRERNDILTGFENGSYPAIVANQILDEGVDLPDAKVAIVIGGSSSTRQAKQRLGRILRKSAYGGAVMYEVVLPDTGEIYAQGLGEEAMRLSAQPKLPPIATSWTSRE